LRCESHGSVLLSTNLSRCARVTSVPCEHTDSTPCLVIMCNKRQPGILRCVALRKFTDVSEMHTASIIALTMTIVRTSETSVNFYRTTRRNIPHSRRRDNLTSQLAAECQDEVGRTCYCGERHSTPCLCGSPILERC
jgi:hypothetical protein